jgi:hypothetical protein
MTTIVAIVLASALFFGPLLWRMRADERRARADAIAADVRAAINHRFRGETYLTVQVTPSSFWRAGWATLSAPAGFEWLLEESWRDVKSAIPADYDLVLRGGRALAVASPRAAEVRQLPRAA